MALHMGPKAVYDSKGFSGDPVGRERQVKKMMKFVTVNSKLWI